MTTLNTRLPREIAPNIYWVGACNETDQLEDEVIHVYNSAYLVIGAEQTLLVDTTAPRHWKEVEAQLTSLLGDRELDWLMPTHSEIPHGGNLERLCGRFPKARVVGDVRDYHLHIPQFSDRLVPCDPLSVLDLGGGYRVVLLPAIIKDMPSTQWGYEESQKVMFVSDAFAYSHHPPLERGGEEYIVHGPGECGLMSDELPVPPSASQAAFITRAALYWTRYVNIRPFFERFTDLVAEYPADLVCPAHGSVIRNLDAMMPTMWEAHRQAYLGRL